MIALSTDWAPEYIVGLTYNVKGNIQSEVEDIEAEYDSIETINNLKETLEQLNCKVILLEADRQIFSKLENLKFDIIFNIAEGIYGRGREGQIPAILDFYKIPYTGSDSTTLCVGLDKALTKRLLSTIKVKTPQFQLVDNPFAKIDEYLKYPLIVKPNAQGSSKGIHDFAVAHDLKEAEALVKGNIKTYEEPLLVEEYIEGREFTIGVLGNGSDKRVFHPMEIIYKDKGQVENIYSYNVKKDYKEYIEYICPAVLKKEIEAEMMETAERIYDLMECRDFSRIDFRLSKENEVYFIEINPLPGLAMGYSDYPMLAGFCGVEYKTLIKSILNSTLKRYGKKPIE